MGDERDSLLGFDLDEESWFKQVRAYSGAEALGRIGPYELLAEIGRGGQGIVYKARQPRTGRIVALKRVSAAGEGSEAFRRRFEREIRTAAALNHPNIVTIFGCDTVDGQALLLMEFIDGLPVDRWVESLGLPGESGRTAAVVALFERLCRAVAHAHQHGIIHRDLKPSNVLVVEGREQGTEVGGQRSEVRDQTSEVAGAHSAFRILNSAFTDSAIRNPVNATKAGSFTAIPKVLDFGLARLLSPYVNESLFQTHTTGFVGTPAYASPEHFADDGAAVDVRSDIYAVGVMLYQALTDRLPYDGKLGFSALMKAIQERDPPRPSSLASGLARELEVIVLKALAKDKSQRYQSMDAFADDLRRHEAGETVLAHPPTAGYQLRKLVRRHKLAFTFSVVILLLVVGSAVLATVLGLRERAARQDADLNSYVASLAAASVAIRADDAASAQNYLSRAPSNLRNWEWRYFQAQADQSVSTQAGCKEALAVDGKGRPILWQTDEGVRWSGDPGQVQAILDYPRQTPVCVVSPSLRYLLMITDDGDQPENVLFTLSDYRTGRLMARWGLPENGPVDFAPDDRTLVFTDTKGSMYVLKLPLGRLEKQGAPDGASSGPLLLTDSDFQRLRLHESLFSELAFSPDGRKLATHGGQGGVKIVNVDTLEILQTMQVGERPTRALAFSPDGRTLAVGSVDKRLSHWDVISGKQLWVSTGHVELISDVAFSPDGSRIASGSWDKTIRIWDSASGACVGRLLGHQAGIGMVAFLGDGDRLVSVDRGGTLKNWRLSNLRPPIAAGNYRRVLGIAESPKATKSGWLAICESTDDTWRNSRVSLIDLRGRRMKGVLWTDEWIGARGRGADVCAVEISRDGQWLATGGGDGVVRLWRCEDLANWVGNGDAAPQPARQLEVLVEGEQRRPPHLGSVRHCTRRAFPLTPRGSGLRWAGQTAPWKCGT